MIRGCDCKGSLHDEASGGDETSPYSPKPDVDPGPASREEIKAADARLVPVEPDERPWEAPRPWHGARSLPPSEYPSVRPLLRPHRPLTASEEVLRWRTQRLEAWENWNGLVAPELRCETPGAAAQRGLDDPGMACSGLLV